MKFSKITFSRAMFIDGFCSGASTLTDVEVDIIDDGLGFTVGDEMTIVPWAHVLTAKFRRAETPGTRASQAQWEALSAAGRAQAERSGQIPHGAAIAQPPPPPKNKRR